MYITKGIRFVGVGGIDINLSRSDNISQEYDHSTGGTNIHLTLSNRDICEDPGFASISAHLTQPEFSQSPQLLPLDIVGISRTLDGQILVYLRGFTNPPMAKVTLTSGDQTVELKTMDVEEEDDPILTAIVQFLVAVLALYALTAVLIQRCICFQRCQEGDPDCRSNCNQRLVEIILNQLGLSVVKLPEDFSLEGGTAKLRVSEGSSIYEGNIAAGSFDPSTHIRPDISNVGQTLTIEGLPSGMPIQVYRLRNEAVVVRELIFDGVTSEMITVEIPDYNPCGILEIVVDGEPFLYMLN